MFQDEDLKPNPEIPRAKPDIGIMAIENTTIEGMPRSYIELDRINKRVFLRYYRENYHQTGEESHPDNWGKVELGKHLAPVFATTANFLHREGRCTHPKGSIDMSIRRKCCDDCQTIIPVYCRQRDFEYENDNGLCGQELLWEYAPDAEPKPDGSRACQTSPCVKCAERSQRRVQEEEERKLQREQDAQRKEAMIRLRGLMDNAIPVDIEFLDENDMLTSKKEKLTLTKVNPNKLEFNDGTFCRFSKPVMEEDGSVLFAENIRVMASPQVA